MEEGAKKRLAGAAAAVVLLVIFVPMLLEEDAQSPVSEQEMSAPPAPDFDRGYDGSVVTAPAEPAAPELPEPRGPIADESPVPRELTPPALFEAPATAEPEIEPGMEVEFEPELELELESEIETESAAVAIEEPPPRPEEEPAPAPTPVSEPQRAPEPPPARKPPAAKPPPAREPPTARPPPAAERKSAKLSSWVIQVASMQDRTRAYSLVQDLRAKGFPAYIEEAQVRNKLWHRVRVGPEMDRGQIEAMASSLENQTRLNVQIQRYP